MRFGSTGKSSAVLSWLVLAVLSGCSNKLGAVDTDRKRQS